MAKCTVCETHVKRLMAGDICEPCFQQAVEDFGHLKEHFDQLLLMGIPTDRAIDIILKRASKDPDD